MIRSGRLRSALYWTLLAGLLAGASVPHSHPLLLGGEDGGAPASSARVVTDDSSNTLRWHSILRIEQDDCVACHAQRTTDLSRPVAVRAVSQPRTPLVAALDVPVVLRERSASSTRGPPSLL